MSANYISSSDLKTILHSEFQPNGEADRVRYAPLLMQVEMETTQSLVKDA